VTVADVAAKAPLFRKPDRAPVSLARALHSASVEHAAAVLPSSRQVVSVPVYVRREILWTGEAPRGLGAIPYKRLYAFEGDPLYPELLVVRLLERAGWGAAWRKTWNGVSYWRDVNETVEPGPLAMSIVEQITRQAGYEGSWDIVAWRDRELRLLASRPAGGQRVSAYMADWLDAAMRMGVPAGCFAVVEHDAPPKPRVPRPTHRRTP
jgi:hypothetical protein